MSSTEIIFKDGILTVNDLEQLEDYVESGAHHLKVVNLSRCKIKELSVNTFSDCDNLEKVILPEGLKEIYEDFHGCYRLTQLNIPESVELINGVFDSCGIEGLVLPKNLRSCFLDGLKFIDMSRCEKIKIMSKDNISIGNSEVVYLPPNIEKIGDLSIYEVEYCFAPASLKSIGEVNGVGIFCTSPKIELSRKLRRSIVHVPSAHLEIIQSSAKKAGLRESTFIVDEMSYLYKYMYAK